MEAECFIISLTKSQESIILKFLDKKIEAILFDMDGVLIDSYEMHKKGLELTSAEYGFKVSEADFISIFGKTSYEGMKSLPYCKDWSKEKIMEFNDKQDGMFRKIFRDKPALIAGALEFAREMKSNGLLMAIGTSAPRANAEVFIDSLNLDGLFKTIISGDDVANGKPNPEIYLKCAELMKIKPEHCLVFEDSIMGIQSGKAANMSVIALSTTHKKNELSAADYIVRDFRDEQLKKILKYN
jgi:beta-phosphoglucomutase